MKKLAAGILGLGIFGAAGAQASDYGLCINRSQGDWRKQVVCNQDETRSLMREITTIYGRLARNPLFGKFNRGAESLDNQFKSWKAYRDNYCLYYEASKSGYGDEEFHRTDCLRTMTE